MKIKKEFVKRKIGDKYLVVSTAKGSDRNSMFIEMNETSSFIWDMIDKGCDIEKTAKQLSEKYNVSFEKAEADVTNLVARMKSAGIFE